MRHDQPNGKGRGYAFNGGVSTDSKQYLVIKAGLLRDKRVHVLVAEAMLRRELLPSENIHHKDGDKKNPHWTNLIVVDVRVHGAVSKRQHWYLKQKFSAEEAAWRAFFDVTGKTYAEVDVSFNPEELERA
jgi:hypothetical protein